MKWTAILSILADVWEWYKNRKEQMRVNAHKKKELKEKECNEIARRRSSASEGLEQQGDAGEDG